MMDEEKKDTHVQNEEGYENGQLENENLATVKEDHFANEKKEEQSIHPSFQTVDSPQESIEEGKVDNSVPTEKEEPKNEPLVENVSSFTNVEDALMQDSFGANFEENVVNPVPALDSPGEKLAKKKSKVVPIVMGVAVLVLATLSILYFVFHNSKNLFLGAINKEYTELTRNLSVSGVYDKAKNSSVVVTGEAGIQVSKVDEALVGSDAKQLLDVINQLKLRYTYGIDYKNKKMSYLLGYMYGDKDMLQVNVYGQEKNMYVELKDLFSKYIRIPYEELDTMFEDPNTSLEDMKMMTKAIKDATLNALDSNDFKKTKATIQIGEKEEKTKKISYTVNQKNMPDIIASVITTLKKDKSFLNILQKYSGKTEKEIIKSLNKMSAEAKNKDWDEVTVSIYFKGITNQAVQYELQEKSSNMTFVYQKDGKEKRFTIAEEDTEWIRFAYEEKTNTESKMTVVIPSLDIDGSIQKTKTGGTSTYDFTFRDSKDTIKITGKCISKAEEKGKDTNYAIDFTMNMESGNQALGSIKITSNGTSTIGAPIESKEDFTNNIAIEEMTEEHSNEIMTNIMNNETFMSFMNNIVNISSNDGNVYNE